VRESCEECGNWKHFSQLFLFHIHRDVFPVQQKLRLRNFSAPEKISKIEKNNDAEER